MAFGMLKEFLPVKSCSAVGQMSSVWLFSLPGALTPREIQHFVQFQELPAEFPLSPLHPQPPVDVLSPLPALMEWCPGQAPC